MIVVAVVLALLLFYGAGHADCATTIPQNSTDDMLSLLDIRKEISSDPSGFLTSWNTNNSSAADYCGWNGVTCSRTHPGRVIELKLSSQSLQGRISPSLGNLTFLRILDLSSNMLAGPIPPNIGSLFHLKILYLDSNNFTGAIPSSLGNISKLEQLVLQDNQLIGTIPQDLGKLSNMYRLLLGHNRLSGSIPTKIVNQSSLQILGLEANFLRMALPSNIGNTLPNLLALSLYSNIARKRFNPRGIRLHI
jgi:hypothetical protein